jgi:hypothetical protein
MRRITIVVAIAVVSVMFSAPLGLAQQPPPSGPPAKPEAPAPAMDAHAHMAQHMEMCRQMMGQGGMMGGGMGPGMMGMPTMMGGDPKQQAEMMAMRGEMMKAMGDIMLKYAQRMRPAK